jgi:hypothetical protein
MTEMSAGTRTAIVGADWVGLVSISVVLPVVLTIILGMMMRKIGWIKPGDLKLE